MDTSHAVGLPIRERVGHHLWRLKFSGKILFNSCLFILVVILEYALF